MNLYTTTTEIYFESGSQAELVATLKFEPSTPEFWTALELEARALGYDKVTESVEEQGDLCSCGRYMDEHDLRDYRCDNEDIKHMDEVDQYTTSEGEVLS
ncbi:hypothetical protein CMI37_34730 [Candidatus Pacearchaeota archaeon]|nr:hypothetical protein [Candidatus Pacearchaeota archaeon]